METCKNKLAFHARHGDVLIIKVKSIPEGAKLAKRDGGKLVLAYGEVTNHSHSIAEKSAKGFLIGDALYLDLENKAALSHEEHGIIELDPGIYRVIRQVEYRRKEMVRVQD